jgi:hypothetical protein
VLGLRWFTGAVGRGRSTRKDGRVDYAPTVQAGDGHAVIMGLITMRQAGGGRLGVLASLTLDSWGWPDVELPGGWFGCSPCSD